MKKTLITALIALGLAASASAVTLSDAVLKETGTIASSYTGDFSAMLDSTTSGVTGQYPNLTIMLVLDLDTLPTFTSAAPSADTQLFTLSGTKTSDNTTMTGIGMGLSRFAASDANTIAWTTWQGDKNGTWAGRFEEYAASGKTVLTMVLDSAGAHVSVSNGITQQTANNATGPRYSGVDYTTITFGTAENIFGAIDGVYIFDEALTASDIKTLSAQAIAASVPEPATATLSLLALAGLAARRRRK